MIEGKSHFKVGRFEQILKFIHLHLSEGFCPQMNQIGDFSVIRPRRAIRPAGKF